jgi:rhamnulose-1-phosphate aldolase
METATNGSVNEVGKLIIEMGEAGQRLSQIDASEGAAGNLSCYLRGPVTLPSEFNQSETIELPIAVPELVGGVFIVSGSGSRLREIAQQPMACLGCLEVNPGGLTGHLRYTRDRRFSRLTSEFNSHMAVHRDHVVREKLGFHAVVHGQPRKLTYFSHLEAYQNSKFLNERLLRWQPEAIVNLPEGIAVLPFLVPGQRELMEANEVALRTQRLVVWSKHGVMARSSASLMAAVDLIEYVETAANYEYLDQLLGGRAKGLLPEEMKAVCSAYSIHQTVLE